MFDHVKYWIYCSLIGWIASAAPVVAQEPYSTSTLSRIAFGSCLDQDKPRPIWNAVVDAHSELFLFVGNVINADTTNLNEKAAAYAKLASQPEYQHLLQSCPIWATWDDADYGAGDAGADFTNKAASQKLFLDFFNEPASSPRRQRPGIYDARLYGPVGRRLQVILLDTRYFRGPLTPRSTHMSGDGPWDSNENRSSSMLGMDQWMWLRTQLRIPAELRIIVSSIQVIAEDHHWDKWMNLPHERKLLFDMIGDTEADGILLISGNRRQAELSMMIGPAGYPLYDLTSSSLNMKSEMPVTEINSHGVSDRITDHNFGLITVDWDNPDPLITLEIRDEEGKTRIRHEIRLSILQPQHAAGP